MINRVTSGLLHHVEGFRLESQLSVSYVPRSSPEWDRVSLSAPCEWELTPQLRVINRQCLLNVRLSNRALNAGKRVNATSALGDVKGDDPVSGGGGGDEA